MRKTALRYACRMSLTKREAKKRQMVRTSYAGLGIGALIVLYAVTGGGILLGIIGLVILVIAGWATRALRSL
jgi:hypothetical protein